MLKNYFKTALRSLVKNRTTSFINLFGLSIGLTAAVFIFLWIQNEITVDDYQPDHIYRISYQSGDKTGSYASERTSFPFYIATSKDILEVTEAVIMSPNAYVGFTFNVNNQLFSEKTSAWVDRNWFNLFNYFFLQGMRLLLNKTRTPYSDFLRHSDYYIGYGVVWPGHLYHGTPRPGDQHT